MYMQVCVCTQGDAIGPLNIRCYQNLPIDSVHTRLLNFSRLAPVRPVQKTTGWRTWTYSDLWICLNNTDWPKAFHTPGEWIHSNWRWLFQASVKQNLHLCAIEVWYRNCFGAKVRPVQVFIDPIHSDPHRSLDIIHHFIVSFNVSSFVQHSTERYQVMWIHLK